MALAATIKRILTLKCEESTRLVSESLDRDLPAGERIAVRMHAVCCKSCRRFERQLRAMREALRRRTDTGDAVAPAGLTPEARDRIRRSLQRARSE